MSHELTQRANGTAEMAYVGDTPWHGLGQKLDQGAPIETWLEAAGMNWSVRRAPVLYYADRAQTDLRQDKDSVVLVRGDTGSRLGIVSADYNIVQPFEILEFFRDLVDDAGFTLETAGTLFGGKRYWALAKVAEAKLCKWDKIGAYVLLSTSADGSKATEARETSIRVVCNNTLTLAQSLKDRRCIRINHRSNFDPAAIKAKLQLTEEHFGDFIEAANTLTRVKVSEAAAEDFLMKLLRPKRKLVEEVALEESPFSEEVEEEVRKPRALDDILGLFQGAGIGSNEPGAKGTLWGLVNSVTEYVDHHATARTDSHRLDRAWFGTGDQLKTDAFERALALI